MNGLSSKTLVWMLIATGLLLLIDKVSALSGDSWPLPAARFLDLLLTLTLVVIALATAYANWNTPGPRGLPRFVLILWGGVLIAGCIVAYLGLNPITLPADGIYPLVLVGLLAGFCIVRGVFKRD